MTINSTQQMASIVFIDGSLPDLQTILSGLDPSVTAIVLDPMQDGIQLMADTLVGVSGLSAIHVISHGSSGCINLGTAQLTQDTLAQYQTQLAAIGNALSATGDLLLYGCNVAQGDVGQAFISALASATGADVAASTDLTGAAFLGGNWVLEANTGSIEAASLNIGNSFSILLDDYAGDTSTTDRLTVTAPINGVIDFVGDKDCFRVYLTAGTGYTFDQVQTPQTQIYSLDSYLQLYDPSGVWIAADDDSGGNRNARFSYVPTASGDYYLMAEANSWTFLGTLTGSYQLSVSVNQAPVVTGNAVSYGINQSIAATALFSASDPDGNSLTQYAFYDPLGSGYFDWSNSTGINWNSSTRIVTVQASSLGNVTYHVGAGSENISVCAADWASWGTWATVTVSENHAPVVTGNAVSADIGQSIAATSLFSASDPDGNSITSYGFYDPSGYGYFDWSSSTGVNWDSITRTLTVQASSLGNVTYHTGDGSESIGVCAFDGALWSDWAYSAINTPVSLSIVALGAEKMEGNSGTTPFTFTVMRTGSSSGSATVDWIVESGGTSTSANATDFGGAFPSGTLSFNAGDTAKTITVSVAGDSTVEPTESFIVTLSNPSNTTLGTSSATGTIYNDDVAHNTLRATDIFLTVGDEVEKAGMIRAMADFAKAAYLLQTWETVTGGQGPNDTSPINDYSTYAKEAYDAVNSQGWAPLDLNPTLAPFTLLTTSSTSGKNLTVTNSMSGGYYTNGNAAAFVARSGDAVVISFGGTNDNAPQYSDSTNSTHPYDSNNDVHPDVDQWGKPFDGSDQSMADYYALFAPLLSSLERYVTNNNIGKIYVTGHSLGGAMAINYMSTHLNDSKYECVTFAAPAFTFPTPAYSEDIKVFRDDSRILQIEIDEDPVPATWAPVNRPGKEIMFVGDQTEDEVDWYPLGQFNDDNHSMDYYRQITKSVDPTSWQRILSESGDQTVLIGATSGPYFYPTTPIRDNQPGDQFDTYFIVDGRDSRTGAVVSNSNDALTDPSGVRADIFYGGFGNDTLTGGSDNELMLGGPGDDSIQGKFGADRIFGDDENDFLDGGGGNDTLNGGAGNDTLDGGAGVDTLVGGAGDDTYIVDLTTTITQQDTLTETEDGGTDILKLSGSPTLATVVTLSLPKNLENFDASATGTTLLNLTGNAADNILTGNAAANVLNGVSGADTLIGGAGDDTYVVNNVGDVITENVGDGTADLVKVRIATAGDTYTLGGNIENGTLINVVAYNLTGNAQDNALTGNTKDNILDGGTGADILIGGNGNDTYIVNSVDDTVTETVAGARGGIDLVQSSVNWALGANVENLTLTGTGNIDGTGNKLDNVITGNAANNTLDGGAGADTLVGGAGDDTYIVDLKTRFTWGGTIASLQDTITEAAGGGIDTLQLRGSATLGTLTLAKNLENLDASATGMTQFNLTGNVSANTLTGNAADNLLDGKAGADILTGGAGNDKFVFSSALNATTNNDTLTDFSHGYDTIQLSKAIFKTLGVAGSLNADFFYVGVGAHDANDHIIYDAGALYYDPDGTGAAAQVQFATLLGAPAIASTDLFVV